MPAGIIATVDNGFATLDFVDKSLRGPALAELVEIGGPASIETITRDGPRRKYRVPAGNAQAAGLLDGDEVGDKYGIPVVNKRISVSPIAVVAAPFGPDGMVRVCKALDEAAKEAGVDFLGGFSALVEKGFAKGDRALIEALPQALAETDRICSSINVASSRSGINMDAVALMGQQILKVADATADRGGLGRDDYADNAGGHAPDSRPHAGHRQGRRRPVGPLADFQRRRDRPDRTRV